MFCISLRYQPDLTIRHNGSFLGDDIYNTDGRNQSSHAALRPRETALFKIKIQNDGDGPDDFALNGTRSTSELRIRYSVRGVDVTAEIVAGTYLIGNLRPQATERIQVAVTPRSSAQQGIDHTVQIKATSVADPDKNDAVAARVRVR